MAGLDRKGEPDDFLKTYLYTPYGPPPTAAHRIPVNLSYTFVGAASLGGPTSYAMISEFQGHFVQRFVGVALPGDPSTVD